MESAVEWLREQISNSIYYYKIMEDINSKSTIAQFNIFEQAKQMEKEQIMDAFRNGLNDWYDKDTSYYENAEQYYNKTFNK
jgi:hypothetical protein